MAANIATRSMGMMNYARYYASRHGGRILGGHRNYSSSKSEDNRHTTSEDSREPLVGMSSDGSTLICWHPEPAHPYEHTQPISYTSAEAKEGEGQSPLKDKLVEKYLLRLRPDGPNIHELTNITYTTKHRWYPNSKKKFEKRDPPTDREGI